jgi:hypothetical protein
MDDGQQAWSPYLEIEACNYTANAQVNDGSCRYIDECGYCSGTSTFNQHLDCNSVCFGDDGYMGQFLTPLDSLYNIHSPNNGIDSCGECDGDGASCIASLYINNLTVVENSDEDIVYLLDVYMKSVLDVAGFQFDVTGFQLINAYGGSSYDNNFTVLADGYRVLGFNVVGATITAGDNLLVQVELFVNNSATQICLDQIILSDINGGPMNPIEHPGQCITLGCSDPLACNYNEASSFNFNCQFPSENYDCDGNCINMDCAGICGGDTIEDICGECDPCGNNLEGPCVDSTTGADLWNDCEKVVYGISSVNRNLGTLNT